MYNNTIKKKDQIIYIKNINLYVDILNSKQKMAQLKLKL